VDASATSPRNKAHLCNLSHPGAPFANCRANRPLCTAADHSHFVIRA
jgi:hypothetical protein